MTEHTETNIITRELDRDVEDPAVQIAELVADVRETDTTEMSQMYEVTDHILDNLFSQPPDPKAQFEISFSYEGFRISVNQKGTVELIDTDTD